MPLVQQNGVNWIQTANSHYDGYEPKSASHNLLGILRYWCQAQFQLASPVPLELSLALSLLPTTSIQPGK